MQKFEVTDIKDMREYNPDYHADGKLGWKRIGKKTGAKGHRKKKTYPQINIDKIIVPDSKNMDENILEKSRVQYQKSKQMIPVFVSCDFHLISGYEQYVLAKELGMNTVPFQRRKMDKTEQRKFSHHASSTKVGNKKYKMTTVDGKIEYISMCQKKRFNMIKNRLGKMGLIAEYIGNHNIRIVNGDGECVKKQKSLASSMKFLNTHAYKEGKFIKIEILEAKK